MSSIIRSSLLQPVKTPLSVGDGKTPGVKQEHIRLVQMALMQINYPIAGVVSTDGSPNGSVQYSGVFTKHMAEVVKEFQKWCEIYDASGVVDQDTLLAIDRCLMPVKIDFYMPRNAPLTGTANFEQVHEKETLEFPGVYPGWNDLSTQIRLRGSSQPATYELRMSVQNTINENRKLYADDLLDYKASNVLDLWAEAIQLPDKAAWQKGYFTGPKLAKGFQIRDDSYALMRHSGAFLFLEGGCRYQGVAAGIAQIRCTFPDARQKTRPRRVRKLLGRIFT